MSTTDLVPRPRSRRLRLRLLLGLLAAALAAALAPLSARATPGLPGQVRSSLQLDYTPACSLCHEEGKTGSGTVFTPFALSARARGLVAGGEGGGRSGSSAGTSLVGALARMTTDQVDSDGDGVDDVAELKDGTDPNVFGPVPIATLDPTYGCSSTGGPAPLPALLAALFFLASRRSRVRAHPAR
jgi:uncharacterized protein (TIGR03382 family)